MWVRKKKKKIRKNYKKGVKKKGTGTEKSERKKVHGGVKAKKKNVGRDDCCGDLCEVFTRMKCIYQSQAKEVCILEIYRASPKVGEFWASSPAPPWNQIAGFGVAQKFHSFRRFSIFL